ncbi:MAG: patatin-like phospholipase family protein, partial [Gemmatimonadaceae bacterium]
MKVSAVFVPIVTAACIATSFSSCAAVHRPPATFESLSADAVTAAQYERAAIDSTVERLARRAVKRGDRTIDILLLSGGGQHGAYGAGFLRGWRSSSTNPMPTFDMVTGISTGALQAPFALIGTQASLDTLSAIYLRSAERIAPTLDWFFWLRHTGGLVNTKRYTNTIDELLHGKFGDDVRQAFLDGRQLRIGTTDVDLGIGHTWDLSREYVAGDAGALRTRQLLTAATAIPGIFPTVNIDGHVHYDGGVITAVLPVLDLDGYRALARSLRSHGVNGDVTVRLYTIMNLWTHAGIEVTDPSNRGKLSSRATLLLLFAGQPQVLNRLTELSRAVSADVPGLKMEVHVTAIPAHFASEPGAAKLFDTKWMISLEKVGYERARSTSPWDTVVSGYMRP